MTEGAHFECVTFTELGVQRLYEVMHLRQLVFVVEQECIYLDADLLDPVSLHLLGVQQDQLVAYARLIPAGVVYDDHAAIGRVVTAPTVRGSGLGRALVDRAVVECRRAWPQQDLKLSAQARLQRFYEVYGFSKVGDEYLEDGIPHIAMTRGF